MIYLLKIVTCTSYISLPEGMVRERLHLWVRSKPPQPIASAGFRPWRMRPTAQWTSPTKRRSKCPTPALCWFTAWWAQAFRWHRGQTCNWDLVELVKFWRFVMWLPGLKVWAIPNSLLRLCHVLELVVWNMAFNFFHILGIIIPTD